MRLRLDLNLDVEVTLKASIREDFDACVAVSFPVSFCSFWVAGNAVGEGREEDARGRI